MELFYHIIHLFTIFDIEYRMFEDLSFRISQTIPPFLQELLARWYVVNDYYMRAYGYVRFLI